MPVCLHSRYTIVRRLGGYFGASVTSLFVMFHPPYITNLRELGTMEGMCLYVCVYAWMDVYTKYGCIYSYKYSFTYLYT